MTDDELDRLLRGAHPGAPDGWSESPAGRRALDSIRAAVSVSVPHPSRPGVLDRLRPPRRLRFPAALGAGLVAAAVTLTLVGLAGSTNGHPPARVRSVPPAANGALPIVHPPDMALAAYDGCTGMLADLRAHTATQVQPYGLRGGYQQGGILYDTLGQFPAPVETHGGTALSGEASTARAPLAAGKIAPLANVRGYSTTNVQETGVGEPDLVDTDGRRIVSVTGGALRVTDVATRKVTGTLDLGAYANAATAQLLLAGNRALVLLGGGNGYAAYGSGGTTAILVDLRHAPSIVGTFHTAMGYVDARMVGDTVRLVAANTPQFTFPTPTGRRTNAQRIAANRKLVEHAPLTDWLPSYTVTAGGASQTRQIPCDAVRHPASYTGTSMLTVFTVDLGATLTHLNPISVAADATTVYSTADSLYVAGADADGKQTELHLFALRGDRAPTYLGSGSVPGTLLDSYSLSQYGTALRVVTTTARYGPASTSLYMLDAATLTPLGHVSGLGKGEQLRAVRFLGALAYVVTFRPVDPLYVVDLHDARHPHVAGQLTTTGYSDYLYPVRAGQLLGVGKSVRGGEPSGLQVSLIDVSHDAKPQLLDRIIRTRAATFDPTDPHAFLYWPAAHTAVVSMTGNGRAYVLRVGDRDLHVAGSIQNNGQVVRSLVVGHDLWTLSGTGLTAHDLGSLRQVASVSFS